jgi:hypothetical protein
MGRHDVTRTTLGGNALAEHHKSCGPARTTGIELTNPSDLLEKSGIWRSCLPSISCCSRCRSAFSRYPSAWLIKRWCRSCLGGSPRALCLRTGKGRPPRWSFGVLECSLSSSIPRMHPLGKLTPTQSRRHCQTNRSSGSPQVHFQVYDINC